MTRPKRDAAMPLTAHLEELRSRLIVSVLAILITTIVGFILADQIISIVKVPAGGITLHVFSPMDGFFVKWRIALFTGLALASPVWVYELVAFVVPGLSAEERRVVLPLIGAGFVLFAIGVAFGYYLLFGMINVLMAMFGAQLDYFPSADAYISFVIFFLLSTGVAFELPVLLYGLVRLHVISTDLLRKQRRYFYFGMFVFAEIITPVSDPIVAPLTITVPLVILYELTLMLARWGERRREQALAEFH
ncbi:MAG: twin-arginine translocase subunit TatC [Anaerolineae bacterium]